MAAIQLIEKVYFDMADHIVLISGTLNLDPSYEGLKNKIREKYERAHIDMRDPQTNPFHEDLSRLEDIMQGMVQRTKEAEHIGAKLMPITVIFIDDLMVGSGTTS